jgi:plastocyanin
VVAATPGDDGWDVQTVAEIAPCAGCPDPARAGIAVTQDGPVVVYADPEQGVMAARLDGSDWNVETVEAGADGTGISVAAGADGAVAAAYYASPGSVSVATSDGGGGWQAGEAAAVGEAASPDGGTETDDGSDGRSTGIALTDDGTVYLAYVDLALDAVQLASAAEGQAFEPVETRATEAGRWPDVAATPDGATVSMTWYAPERQDLAYGSFQDVSGIVVAAPSPPFAVSTETGGETGECGPEVAEAATELEVTAPVGATGTGFEPTCLVAPAGEPLVLTFENADTGQLHNADFLTEAGGETLFTSGEPVTGPETQGPADVDPQEEGSYYFQCDVHPDTMTGTFVVVKASKK